MPQMPLYILPTGLRYGNIFRFRTTVRVQIGKPINVGKFIEDHADMTPQEQMNVMKDMLTEGLRSVTFRIPDDADYDATYEICNIAQQQETGRLLKDEAGRRASGVNLQFEANNRTLKRISDMMETDPVAARKLLDLGSEASSLRKAKGISIESVALGRPSVSEIAKSLLVLLTLPYTLLASLFVLPMVAVLSPIFKNIKDPVFKNSVRYVIYLILWPLLMVIYAVVAISVLPWQWALAAILLILPAPTTAHMLWNKMSLALSCARLWSDKKLRHLHAQIKSSLS